MSPGFKKLLLVVGGLSLLVTIGAAGIVSWVDHAGMVVVRVREAGPRASDVSIRVPAALVRAMIALSPRLCVGCASDRIDRWKPLIQTVCRELKDAEDFTLIQRSGADETVQIAKQGQSLVVEVAGQDEHVHVSMPFHLVSAMSAKI